MTKYFFLFHVRKIFMRNGGCITSKNNSYDHALLHDVLKLHTLFSFCLRDHEWQASHTYMYNNHDDIFNHCDS